MCCFQIRAKFQLTSMCSLAGRMLDMSVAFLKFERIYCLQASVLLFGSRHRGNVSVRAVCVRLGGGLSRSRSSMSRRFHTCLDDFDVREDSMPMPFQKMPVRARTRMHAAQCCTSSNTLTDTGGRCMLAGPDLGDALYGYGWMVWTGIPEPVSTKKLCCSSELVRVIE